MDSNFIGDKIDLVEIDEEEVDWINPNLKSITAFPDEHVNSILAPERSDIISLPVEIFFPKNVSLGQNI